MLVELSSSSLNFSMDPYKLSQAPTVGFHYETHLQERVLHIPVFPSFANYQLRQGLTFDFLVGIIEHCYQAYIIDSNPRQWKPLPAEQLGVIEAARQEHQVRCKRGGRDFATLPQWPCRESTVDGFTVRTLEISEVMQAVRPEWLHVF